MTRTEHSPLLSVAAPWEVDRLAEHAARVSVKMTTDLTLGRPERAAALVRYYDGLCRGVGLDTVLAVSQTWHETGFWSSWWFRAPRRNPAGVGVNGARRHAPVPGQEWQRHADGTTWVKGRAFPSYATAAMAHVHGLAMWAGAPTPGVARLHARCLAAGVKPYTPPALAHGSCTEWRHLGWAHNPRHIGWAHPGPTYGAAMARHAQQILAP